MNRDDVGMIEGRGGVCFLDKPAPAIVVADTISRHTSIATSRFKRGSRARYTSPIPPAPMKDRIWYGPSVEPGGRATDRAHYTGRLE